MSDVPAAAPAAPPDLARALRLHAAGALDDAATAYEQLLAGRPDDARALTQLGLVRLQQGRLDEAASLLARAEAADPTAAEPRAWRGEALRRQHALEPAVAAFHAALSRDADFAPAWFNLALAEAERGDRERARRAWQRFSALRPADVRVCRELGRLAYEDRDYAEAARWFSLQAQRTPDDADAAYLAGVSLDRLARLPEAIDWLGKAARLSPQRADIRNALGVARFNLGETAQAIADYRAALALDPGHEETRGNLLMAIQHDPTVAPEQVLAEHVAWAARHAAVEEVPRAAFPNDRDPHRRLKIGYVSPRFCGGPLAHFFLPLLEARDGAATHVTCYATSSASDAATALMRAHADGWRDVAADDDATFLDAIRRDGIDILVDLAGHCPGHRLGVFARRGAPIQFTWMDYVDTTAVPSVDYLVTDALHTPADCAQRFTERVLRLPDTRLCYRPVQPLPQLSASPAAKRGFVTFGCFNRLNKISADVVATWSEILARVSGARLVLKATAFEAQATRDVVRQRFERHGVDPRRLDLRPYSTEMRMMAEYAEIDVVLDPFPYNGCTTTCDALSMGVPVVTLEGRSLAARHGVALLTACGLPGQVARTRGEYVALAERSALAGGSTLAARTALRKRFLASPVCDGPRFARAFERLFRDAWQEWCEHGR